jgi:flagellin
MSFLEVQDGMLETVGNIIDRMSELKGLSSQDPMKSAQDKATYDNEFRDLQVQLYDISQQKFNGVSLFANFVSTDTDGVYGSAQTVFWGKDQTTGGHLDVDNTMTIYTSAEGSEGSKVSVYKASLLSALSVTQGGQIGQSFDVTGARNAGAAVGNNTAVQFASETITQTLQLSQISVNVINTALENIAFLRAQNGGVQSRLSFNLQSLAHQKTNMKAALGRIVDADIAEETTNLSKYQVLSQAAASMLSQANANTEIALMLLR